jgi:hypothetical protein
VVGVGAEEGREAGREKAKKPSTGKLASGLTLLQETFIDLYLYDPEVRGRAAAAAIKAGYSKNNVRVAAERLMDYPKVQEVLAEERNNMRVRMTLAASDAMDTLCELCLDKQVPAAVRRSAASDLLDRAGYLAKGAEGYGQSTEVNHRITLDITDRARQILAERNLNPTNLLPEASIPGEFKQVIDGVVTASETTKELSST